MKMRKANQRGDGVLHRVHAAPVKNFDPSRTYRARVHAVTMAKGRVVFNWHIYGGKR